MPERARFKNDHPQDSDATAGATSGEHAIGEHDELTRLRLQIERTRAALEATTRHKLDSVSMLVHDLQSPLSVVIGNSDFMLHLPGQTPENVECLRDVRHAADSMRGMVHDLLDICLGESGALVPKQERVEVGALLVQAQTAMKYRADYRRQQIDVRAPSEPLWVRADRELLRRVLQNLIDSAIKHGPDAGAIRLSAELHAARVVLCVSDDGLGVPPEQRAALFTLPPRLEQASLRPPARSGLGLHFCRVAVEAMSGAIWAQDATPSGNTMCVELPRAT